MASVFSARNHPRPISPARASGITPLATRPKQLATESMDTSTAVSDWLPPSAITICPAWLRTSRPLPMPTKTTKKRSQKLAEPSASRGRSSRTSAPARETGVAASAASGLDTSEAAAPATNCRATTTRQRQTTAQMTMFRARLAPKMTLTTLPTSSSTAIPTTTPKPRPSRFVGWSRSPWCRRGTTRSSGAQAAPRTLRPSPRNSRKSDVWS
mmetsp:Transcript_110974/g.294886  ORF Transcript_110974/g.294886 Transcript_110974/m.294886 type:complete len:212 (+) Transcript_110974:516-1151(+)